MRKWLLWGLPALLLAALVVWRFNNRPETTDAMPGPGGGGGRGRPVAVGLAAATSRSIVQVLESVGNVETPYRVQISPKTTGRIEFLDAREGDRVEKGQVLLRIDPTEMQASVAQAEANVAEARSRLAQAKLNQGATRVGVSSQIKQQQAAVSSAQSELNQALRTYEAQVQGAKGQVQAAEASLRNARASLDREKATLTNVKARLDRTENLYRQGFIAAQDVDDARTAVDVQQGAVTVATGQVQSAEAQVDIQKQNLTVVQKRGSADIDASKARLAQARATLEVAVANRSQNPAYAENLAALQASVNAAVGQLRQAQSRLADTVVRSSIEGSVTARNADPGALASPGSPVLEVQFLDWVFVTAPFPIEQSGLVRPGQSVDVTFDAFPGRRFTGPITHVNPVADPASRQFEVRVRLNNPGHGIRPGMHATVSVVTDRIQAPVVVPREAVRTNAQNESTVVTVDEENVAHVRPVKLGAQDARGVQILEGLGKGERVVILSASPVRDGQKVTLERPGGNDRGGGGGRGPREAGPGTGGGQRARGGGQ